MNHPGYHHPYTDSVITLVYDVQDFPSAAKIMPGKSNKIADRRSMPSMVTSCDGDQYLIEGELGAGGLGVVYLAKRQITGERVALKMPARANDLIAQRILTKEAQLLSVLKHKHIIKLVAYGKTVDDEPYLCLEYINAPTLEQLLKNQRSLSLPRAIEICSQIADALEYTHLHNLIHNDLKPANILIANEGNADWVYVVDFGIATENTGSNHDTDEPVITTLLYAPPELYKHKKGKNGHADIGQRADVYQLGLIFYECLTGQLPFDVSYSAVLDHRNRGDIVPALSQSGSSILPRSVKSLLLKALARDPDKRQESMQALLDEMRDAVSNIVMPAES